MRRRLSGMLGRPQSSPSSWDTGLSSLRFAWSHPLAHCQSACRAIRQAQPQVAALWGADVSVAACSIQPLQAFTWGAATALPRPVTVPSLSEDEASCFLQQSMQHCVLPTECHRDHQSRPGQGNLTK